MMATETQTECRAEYVVGTIIFMLRWGTRGKLRIWKLDDWFSISAWVFFTMIYAMVEYLCKLTNTNTYCLSMLTMLRSGCRSSNRTHARAAGSSAWSDESLDARRSESNVLVLLLSYLPCLELEGVLDRFLLELDVIERVATSTRTC
jgi:hypothetical protein